jgi:hypothetical protein
MYLATDAGVCRDVLVCEGKIARPAVGPHRNPDHVEEPPEEPTVEPLDDPAEPPYEDDPGPTEMPQHDPEPQEEQTPDSSSIFVFGSNRARFGTNATSRPERLHIRGHCASPRPAIFREDVRGHSRPSQSDQRRVRLRAIAMRFQSG